MYPTTLDDPRDTRPSTAPAGDASDDDSKRSCPDDSDTTGGRAAHVNGAGGSHPDVPVPPELLQRCVRYLDQAANAIESGPDSSDALQAALAAALRRDAAVAGVAAGQIASGGLPTALVDQRDGTPVGAGARP